MSINYKRNHFIPKFMLDYWASQPNGYNFRGVWVYEIDSRRKYFANAQGGKAYDFAVSDDLYIPLIGGERTTALERWFSSLEGKLANLAKQVHEDRETLFFRNHEDAIPTLMSLFALECRSPFNIQILKGEIASSPQFSDLISQPTEISIQQLVLENIINYVNEYALRFSKSNMLILRCENQDVICSDRPVFHHPTLTPRFFALTNKIIIALAKDPLNTELKYTYTTLEPEMLDLLNKRIVLEAREWIVATTENQLNQYVSVVESDEWKTYRESTKIHEEGPVWSWKMIPDKK